MISVLRLQSSKNFLLMAAVLSLALFLSFLFFEAMDIDGSNPNVLWTLEECIKLNPIDAGMDRIHLVFKQKIYIPYTLVADIGKIIPGAIDKADSPEFSSSIALPLFQLHRQVPLLARSSLPALLS